MHGEIMIIDTGSKSQSGGNLGNGGKGKERL